MRYCITMERTQRVAVFFDAETQDAAEEQAAQIYNNASPDDYASGETEGDYSLVEVDTGRTIFDWD